MRQNNFDIVRLALAWSVVFFHCQAIGENPALNILLRFFSGHLAVEGFFAISGFLIFASYERCSSLREYYANRAWRILPGYWLSTLFCLVIAFSFGSFHVGKFLLANLTFQNYLQPNIPGVLEFNPGEGVLNGALWTIKIEVMFYIAVPFIVWLCRKLNRDAVLISLFVLSIVYRLALANYEKYDIQLPGQLSFFLVGALIHYHLAFFKKHGLALMAGAATLYGLSLWTGWFGFRPAGVAGLVLGFCLLLPQIKGPTRWGDFSYGTYVLHFPIIQLLIAAGLFDMNPWLGVLATIPVVAVAAALSWFFVEKPALGHAKSKRLRLAALQDIPNYPPAVP